MDGLEHHHWRCGERFSGTTDGKTHTSHTITVSSHRSAFLSRLLLDGTRPGAGLRLFATGLRRLFGRDAGSIQYGEETLASSYFPRMRMPLRRRNLTRNGPGRESPARVERERRIRPTSFLSQVCLWQDSQEEAGNVPLEAQTICDAALWFWIDASLIQGHSHPSSRRWRPCPLGF